MASVDEKLAALMLPTMRVPDGLGQEYSFPDNVNRLSSHELGTLQLKLTGWYSYANMQLAREESRLGALESVFDQALGVAMDKVARASEKRVIKEAQRSIAINENEKLEQMLQLIIERKALVRRLEAQSEIYHEQVTRLSREQSRRESEAHFGA